MPAGASRPSRQAARIVLFPAALTDPPPDELGDEVAIPSLAAVDVDETAVVEDPAETFRPSPCRR